MVREHSDVCNTEDANGLRILMEAPLFRRTDRQMSTAKNKVAQRVTFMTRRPEPRRSQGRGSFLQHISNIGTIFFLLNSSKPRLDSV